MKYGYKSDDDSHRMAKQKQNDEDDANFRREYPELYLPVDVSTSKSSNDSGLIGRVLRFLNRKKRTLVKKIRKQSKQEESASMNSRENHDYQGADSTEPIHRHAVASKKDEEKATIKFCGKTMECVSSIGQAVHEIMDQLNKNLEKKDKNTTYVISAWMRICKVLSEVSAADYLHVVMPTVLKCAELISEISNLQDDEDKDALDIREYGMGLEDKIIVCETLYCFAKKMGPAFAPYVEKVSEFMEGQLNFHFHKVRLLAAEIFRYLFIALRDVSVESRRALWQRIFPQLLEGHSKETDLEVAGRFLHSIIACAVELDEDEPTIVHLEDFQKIVDEIEKYEKRSMEKKKSSGDDESEDVVEPDTSVLEKFKTIRKVLNERIIIKKCEILCETLS